MELELYDEEKILEKYGVSPERLVDVKGLMGILQITFLGFLI